MEIKLMAVSVLMGLMFFGCNFNEEFKLENESLSGEIKENSFEFNVGYI